MKETKHSFEAKVQIGRKRAIQGFDGRKPVVLRPHPSFTGDEADEFLRIMSGANYTSQARFCHDMVLRQPSPEMKSLIRKLRKPMKSLSDNLNQLTARFHTYRYNKSIEMQLNALLRQLQVAIEGLQCLSKMGHYLADIHERICYEPFYESSNTGKLVRQHIEHLISRTNRTLDVLDNLLINLNLNFNGQKD